MRRTILPDVGLACSRQPNCVGSRTRLLSICGNRCVAVCLSWDRWRSGRRWRERRLITRCQTRWSGSSLQRPGSPPSTRTQEDVARLGPPLKLSSPLNNLSPCPAHCLIVPSQPRRQHPNAGPSPPSPRQQLLLHPKATLLTQHIENITQHFEEVCKTLVDPALDGPPISDNGFNHTLKMDHLVNLTEDGYPYGLQALDEITDANHRDQTKFWGSRAGHGTHGFRATQAAAKGLDSTAMDLSKSTVENLRGRFEPSIDLWPVLIAHENLGPALGYLLRYFLSVNSSAFVDVYGVKACIKYRLLQYYTHS